MEEKEEFARFPIKRKMIRRKTEPDVDEPSTIDRLFETEWEIFVAHLDRATGEFHISTDREVSPAD